MILLKVLKMLWPFIKEMIIGKNSLRYAVRKNRIRVIFFFLVIFSFVINWIAIPKLVIISANYIKLEQELKTTKNKLEDYRDDRIMVENTKNELFQLRARVGYLDLKNPNNGDVKVNYLVDNDSTTKSDSASNSNLRPKHKLAKIDHISNRLNALED